MTKQRVAPTWRKVLITTVATSVLLSGCSWAQETFSRGGSHASDQQARIEGNMRRPENNPGAGTGAEYSMAGAMASDARRPANNPGGAIGAPTVDVNQEHAAPAPTSSAPAAKRNSKGFFSFLYRDDAGSAETASMERRVPEGNRNPSDNQMAEGAATFEAAVPVAGVESNQLADISADYPDLSNVPQAPVGMDAAGRKDAMMSDLTAARAETQNQQMAMNAQVNADGMPAPQTSAVALDGSAVPADNDALEAQFAAIVAAPGAAPATPQVAASQPVIMGAPPRPLDAQYAMADTNAVPAPQITPQTGGEEWVEIGGATNQAVPVEGVAVGTAAEPIAVSPIPVAPNWNGSVGTATAGVHVLPDSRYAARRQALAAQRYARHQQTAGY